MFLDDDFDSIECIEVKSSGETIDSFVSDAIDVKINQFACTGNVPSRYESFPTCMLTIENNELQYLKRLYNGERFRDTCIIFNLSYNNENFLNDFHDLALKGLNKFKHLIEHAHVESQNLPNSNTQNYWQIRHDVYALLFYTRHYFRTFALQPTTNPEYTFKQIQSIQRQLSLFRRMFNNVFDAFTSECIVRNWPSTHGNASSNAIHHLIHAYLDVKWFQVTFARVLELFNEKVNVKLTFCPVADEMRVVIADLVRWSIFVFNQTDDRSLLATTPWVCSCVIEFWVMLVRFVDAVGRDCPFWDHFNYVIAKLLNKNAELLNVNESISITFNETPRNSVLFSFWLLSHVTYLHGYDANGLFLGAQSTSIVSNHPLLHLLVETFCSNVDKLETDAPELYLRVIFGLIADLMLNWWPVKVEPLLVLWEYLSKRINSTFNMRGELTVRDGDKRPSHLRHQIKLRLTNVFDNVLDETSYSTFLKILAVFLKQSKEHRTQWMKIKGRIYSKWTSHKLFALNDVGLYNYVLLFLTIIEAGEFNDTIENFSTQLRDLSATQKKDRLAIVIAAQFILMTISAENARSYEEIASAVAVHLGDTHLVKSELFHVIVDGVKMLFNVESAFDLGADQFIGPWITENLVTCTSSTRFHDLLKVIFHHFINDLIGGRAITDKSLNALKTFFKMVHMGVDKHVAQNDVADLLVLMTILGTHEPRVLKQTFSDLFVEFTSGNVNLRVIRKYLDGIFADVHVTSLLDVDNSSMLCAMRAIFHSNMTEIVNNPNVWLSVHRYLLKTITSRSDVKTELIDNLLTSKDPMIDFFKIFENIDADQLVEYRTLLSHVIDGVDARIKSILMSPSPREDALTRMYVVCGSLICSCAVILNSEPTTKAIFASIITLLVLPQRLYENKKMHPFGVAAVRQSWDLFFRGLFLISSNDTSKLTDMITLYLPYLKLNENDEPFQQQPIIRAIQHYHERHDYKQRDFIVLFFQQQLDWLKKLISSPIASNQTALIDVLTTLENIFKHFAGSVTFKSLTTVIIESTFADVAEIVNESEPNNSVRRVSFRLFIHFLSFVDDQKLIDTFTNLAVKSASNWPRFNVFLELVATKNPRAIGLIVPHLVAVVRTKPGLDGDNIRNSLALLGKKILKRKKTSESSE